MIDDEIDLRQYVRGLFQRWPLIVVLALIGAAAAAVVSFQQSDVYEAVALVSVSAPRSSLSGASANGSLPTRSFPELAQSGDVLNQVLAQSQSVLPGADLAAIQSRLSAEAASDPTLLRLKARDSDPQRAARLANIWADVFVAQAGSAYGSDQAYVKVYTGALSDARNALAKAQSDLAAFQSANQANILAAHLISQQASLIDDLNRQQALGWLAQDTHELMARLSALPATAPASPADDLALLGVNTQLYAASSPPTSTAPSQSSVPLQVQLTTGQPLAGATVADQLALANSLRDTIAARLTAVSGQVTDLEPRILALQGQVAQAQVTETGLVQARDLANAQYEKLAAQVPDAVLAAQASSTGVQIASRAVVPTAKISSRRTSTIGLGAALGLVGGLLAALALEFWRSSSAVKNRTTP